MVARLGRFSADLHEAFVVGRLATRASNVVSASCYKERVGCTSKITRMSTLSFKVFILGKMPCLLPLLVARRCGRRVQQNPIRRGNRAVRSSQRGMMSMGKLLGQYSNVAIALAYAAFNSMAVGVAAGPIFDKYLMELGGSNTFVGIVESLVGAMTLATALPVGFFVDMYSRIRVLRIGAFLAIFASAVSAVAIGTNSSVGICCGLVIGGIALEIVTSASGAVFTDSIPQGQRTAAFTMRDMMQSLGSGVAPLLVAAYSYGALDWTMASMRTVLVLGNLLVIPTTFLLLLFREAPMLLEKKENLSGSSRNSKLVPYIITVCEFITCIGAGMTVKFFSLFFIEDFKFSPAQINTLMAVYPLTIAVFMWLLQRLSRTIGRAQASLLAFTLNGVLFVVLARVQSLPLLIAVFLVRGGLSNATSPIDRSILMDFTPSSTRGRWNAVSSFASATWSGSAFIGGYLSDAHGYRWTFLVTAMFYFCSCILYLPLLWLVPRKE